MTLAVENDAEDVNEFLKRIQELGHRRDQEDEERNRKLEEEILQGRRERQARRAERARSISPTKDSPSRHSPSPSLSASRSSYTNLSMNLNEGIPQREHSLPSGLSTPDRSSSKDPEKPMPMEETARAVGYRATQSKPHEQVVDEPGPERAKPSKMPPSPSSAMPSRSATMSWQRRPTSQIAERPRNRPLSVVAVENAARSPRGTPEPTTDDEEPIVSRQQITNSLATKDPAWFRQTLDRGRTSPAFRKNQVEDNNVVDVGTSRMKMPGMMHESCEAGETAEEPSSPTKNDSMKTDNTDRGSTSHGISNNYRSLPENSSQRFDPISQSSNHLGDDIDFRHSPSLARVQSRTTPSRSERPVSPTKGMGGFVQSAMMKRSESVAKRHAVTSPRGLSRGNSVASNRSGYDGSMGFMSPPPGLTRPNSSNRDTSPTPLSRPTSSHSNTIVTQADRPLTSDSMKSLSSTSNNSYNNTPKKTSLSSERNTASFATDSNVDGPEREESTMTSPSGSVQPSGRLSPTKSWLDSMLNKAETPTAKLARTPPPPAWRSDIIRAKQSGKTESADSVKLAPKHEVVSIGGLMRSPQLSGVEKPSTFNVFHNRFGADSLSRNVKTEVKHHDDGDHDDTNQTTNGPETTELDQSRVETTDPSTERMNNVNEARHQTPSSPTEPANRSGQIAASASATSKPDVPPKKGFRSSLKQSQPLPDVASKTEPEFKNVFGTLRRTKTQNYVAPDQFRELKSNISKSKAEFNITGGPKKSEPRDDFKDAILKKKEDFKKMQAEGMGVPKSSTFNKQPAPLPEALARKATLGKQNAPKNTFASAASPKSSSVVVHKRETIDVPVARLQHETSAPSRMETTNAPVSGLAARFNPGLASVLARGPAPSSSDKSHTSSPVTASSTQNVLVSAVESDAIGSGPQLTHMTKARARGPKRKAPSSNNQPIKTTKLTDELVEEAKSTTARGFDKGGMRGRAHMFETATESHANSSNQPQASSRTDKDTEDSITNQTASILPGRLSKAFPATNNKHQTSSDSRMAGKDHSALATPSPETARKLTPAPLFGVSAPAKAFSDQPKESLSVTVPSENNASDSGVSVKDTVAKMLPPIAASTALSDTLRKRPIKLPTQADEDAALTHGRSQENVAHEREKTNTTQRKIPPSLSTTESSWTEAKSSPKQARMEGPPATGPKPTTPRKVTHPAGTQPSVNSPTIDNFFQNREPVPKFDIDTQAVLSAHFGEDGKIKSLRSQLYQLNSSGKKTLVPAHQEQLLFEGNMYLCTHTFGTATGKKVTEVYLWVGSHVPRASIGEVEALAQREAKSTGGDLVILEQGKETSRFIEALGGIAIIRRGTNSKYDSLARHILCGRRHVGQIVFDEVDFATTSFCTGFPYLVFTQSGKLYLWKGKGSNVEELSCARLIGMDFGPTGEIEDVEEGSEPPAFLSLFGANSKIIKCADHWRLKPKFNQYSTRLFRIDAATPSKISEIVPFTQSDLLPTHIHILDAFFEIYVLVGPQAQSQYASFCTALLFAQDYAILAAGAEDRPSVPYSAVVLEGVPRDMKFCFRKWDSETHSGAVPDPGNGDVRQVTGRGKSLRVVSLSAALEATKL